MWMVRFERTIETDVAGQDGATWRHEDYQLLGHPGSLVSRAIRSDRRGQALSVAEADVVDWTIARPDGTEEGNWMGRFIDGIHATGRPPAGICDP